MQNFIGHDGFIWWVGVVEDVLDPDVLGRCKVRVFGYHDNATQIPTADLPWATAIHSPNTPNLYSPLAVGDWVFGFFLDSLNAQEPAIVGFIPTIKTPRNFKRVDNKGNTDKRTCWEIGNNYVEVINGGHIEFSQNSGKASLTLDANANVVIVSSNNVFSTSSNTTIVSVGNNYSITSGVVSGRNTAGTTKTSVLTMDTYNFNSSVGYPRISLSSGGTDKTSLVMTGSGTTDIYAANTIRLDTSISSGGITGNVQISTSNFSVTTGNTFSVNSGNTARLEALKELTIRSVNDRISISSAVSANLSSLVVNVDGGVRANVSAPTINIKSTGYTNINAGPDINLNTSQNTVSLNTLVLWIKTAWSEANSAHAKANSAFSVANSAFSVANSAFSQANNATAAAAAAASAAAAAAASASSAITRLNNPTFNANGQIVGI